MIEMIVSLLTLLIFFAAIVVPFLYLMYKQKADRAEEARQRTERRSSRETSTRGGSYREGPEAGEDRSPEEGLMSHIADFSSEGLAHDLETRYDHWDEVGSQPGSSGGGKAGSEWRFGSSGSGSWAAGTGSRSSGTGPARRAKGKREPAVMRRLEGLSPLKRAVLLSEIIGAPKALREEYYYPVSKRR